MKGHPTRWTLESRQRIEVNTDPQRRCYNGCHFSSKMVWTDWEEIGFPATKESGDESIRNFQSINSPRTYEYRLLPPTGEAS